MKTVATASTLAICVIMPYFVAFCPPEKVQRLRTHMAIPRLVMVITCEYHYPAHKPPPLFCPMLACTKRDIIAGFYGDRKYYLRYTLMAMISLQTLTYYPNSVQK